MNKKKQSKFILWLKAFRLYSLMVSSAGIIMGTFIAASYGYFRLDVFIFTLLTTWCLHLLCNISNDYGDAVRNTDADHDFGDIRYVQDGLLSLKEVKNMCIVLGILSAVFGTLMIFLALGMQLSIVHIVFFLLGAFAIYGAVAYTNGKKPYGYIGLGDFSVFLFFGIATVVGSYYLQTLQFDFTILIPAAAIGMPIIGLLNNNNIRDISSDYKSGKITIAYRLGEKNARIYQYILITLLFVFSAIYVLLHYENLWQWMFLLMLIPFGMYIKAFYKAKTPHEYHKLMGMISMLTLLFGIVYGLGFYLSK